MPEEFEAREPGRDPWREAREAREENGSTGLHQCSCDLLALAARDLGVAGVGIAGGSCPVASEASCLWRAGADDDARMATAALAAAAFAAASERGSRTDSTRQYTSAGSCHLQGAARIARESGV